jgi:site-specific recombinase XerD
LSGLQVRELHNLRWAEVDLESGLVRIVGDNQRIVELCDEVRELFKHHAWQRSETSTLVWGDNDQQPLSASAIDALVSSAAHVAGVPAAQDINAETVRSTYIAFLARQGIRLDLLEQTVGRLSRQLRDNFQILSPPGASENLQEIERVYPALQATRHEAAGS